MKQNPDRSEVSVCRSFSLKLSKLQKQLHNHYHIDDFLRDQLIISVDKEKIQHSVRKRIPKSSQDAINRIATFLADAPRSAENFQSSIENDFSALNGLGTCFGGEARRRQYRNNFKQRKISSNWIKGVKGCFVCGKNHKARTRHSTQEIRKAIEGLKQKNPSATISLDDLSYISNELCENENESEDYLVYDSGDENNDSDAYNVQAQNQSFISEERKLANNSFYMYDHSNQIFRIE